MEVVGIQSRIHVSKLKCTDCIEIDHLWLFFYIAFAILGCPIYTELKSCCIQTYVIVNNVMKRVKCYWSLKNNLVWKMAETQTILRIYMINTEGVYIWRLLPKHYRNFSKLGISSERENPFFMSDPIWDWQMESFSFSWDGTSEISESEKKSVKEVLKKLATYLHCVLKEFWKGSFNFIPVIKSELDQRKKQCHEVSIHGGSTCTVKSHY